MIPAALDRQVVWAAAGDEKAMSAVTRLYRATDALIARRQAVCRQRGDCCRFGSFGPRLFATTLEFAYFVRGQGRPVRAGPAMPCPYLAESRCTARDHRPIGCRVFFCDPQSADWQGPLSERLARRLRRLHDQLGVPYRYREWLAGLQDLGAEAVGAEAGCEGGIFPQFPAA